MLNWLKESELYPKIYWKNQDHHIGALGRDPNPKKSGRLFGGSSFLPHSDPLWKAFPNHFFLPLIEKEASFDNSALASTSTPINRCDLPDFSAWKRSVEIALQQIEKEPLKKVVLARRTTLHFAKPIEPLEILSKLKNRAASSATLFAFIMGPHSAFLGASPEKLYQRQGDKIMSDALAGTRVAGVGQNLLNRDKEMREFLHVKEFIEKSYQTLCSQFESTPISLLSTGYLEHLHSRVSGILHPHISDEIILKALHPTPALGGFPRDPALSLIQELEPFARGWYGAPVGWMSEQGADMTVGIRSALIQENDLHLFAGAGIVKGSDPESEWNELENKIALFYNLFI